MIWRRAAYVAGIGAVIASGIYGLRDTVKINWLTDSMPRGVYLIERRLPERGEIAASCLTPEVVAMGRERGYLPALKGRGCSHHLYPMAKYTYGVPGDTVTLMEGNILVNSQSTGLRQLHKDSQGRLMPLPNSSQYVLQKGEYWLMSPHRANSFDSRYFGPVPVIYVLKPLWIAHEER